MFFEEVDDVYVYEGIDIFDEFSGYFWMVLFDYGYLYLLLYGFV